MLRVLRVHRVLSGDGGCEGKGLLQHGESALTQPLILLRRDELVDHNLRTVHKVT